MRNRLSNGSKHVALATCLLALGANFSACSDDYILDEQKPAWLNSSIYETLESNGGYTKYLTLLADPDVNSGNDEVNWTEILSRTGSKTLFVATDEAWGKFFADNAKLPKQNPWHGVQSYEQLSKTQKKLLLHTSMLNNAIVMENLSSNEGQKIRGQYLRRSTDVEILDSVAHIAVAELPKSYWDADRQTSEETKDEPEIDQYGRIRDGGLLGYDSIYVLHSNIAPPMIHFTNEYMAKHQITDADFRIFMGRDRITSDVHVYDSRLDSADITCQNGYVNMTEKPLVPLGNMADVIRINGKTNIFNHMMDRFSTLGTMDETATRLFANQNPGKFQVTDTLYLKVYYSKRGHNSTSAADVPFTYDRQLADEFAYGQASLRYDPTWNAYSPIGSNSYEDMGAMFIPNDEQMIHYFNEGGGKNLLKEYTLNPVGTYSLADLETLYHDIDQIPLKITSSLINQSMFDSFAGSVPSKMESLREEGTLEQIFKAEDTKLKADGGNIDTVVMACNGAIYIMNNVYVPSDFNCVATPAFIRSTNKIMRWAIYSDGDLPKPLMGLNYFAYLKAMQSKFTFFLPNDEAMGYYYDPMSFTATNRRLMRFLYTSSTFPFALTSSKGKRVIANYDIKTGVIGADMGSQKLTQDEIINRLRMMLEHNTIVHQNGINAINTEEDEYYLSKNGMGIKVTRENGYVVRAQGGFQLENEREGLTNINPGIQYCNVVEKGDYKNGWTFTLDAPLIPAARSVFSVLSNIERGQVGEPHQYLADEVVASNPYFNFFKLCIGADEELIKKSGLVNEKDYDVSTDQGRLRLENAINKYRTFMDNKAIDQNVQFFNNYRYTVFAPNNAATQKAIDNGLPTWESIQQDFDDCKKDEDGNLTLEEDSARLQYKIIYLTNFIRTHFADNTIFADKSEIGTNGQPVEMTTSSYDRDNGVFIKTYVQRVKGGSETNLLVRDNFSTDQWNRVDGTYKNIMTCDRVCSAKVKNAQSLNGITTEASSYAVVHLIDGTLNHTKLNTDGTHRQYDDDVRAARAYIKKFAIR